MNSSIWPIDGTLTGTTYPSQSGSESKGNERVLHILLTSGLEPNHQMQFSVFKRGVILLVFKIGIQNPELLAGLENWYHASGIFDILLIITMSSC